MLKTLNNEFKIQIQDQQWTIQDQQWTIRIQNPNSENGISRWTMNNFENKHQDPNSKHANNDIKTQEGK